MPEDKSTNESGGEPVAPPPAPIRETKELGESEGVFRKGVDVLPSQHVDPQDAPDMGGLPAAQSSAADETTSGGGGGDSGSDDA